MRFLCVILAGVMVLNGCASRRPAPRTDPYTQSEVETTLAAFAPGDQVRILLTDGTDRAGKLNCIDEELLCLGKVRVPWNLVVGVERYGGRMSGGDFAIFLTVTAVVVGAILISLTLRDLSFGQ